MKSRLACTALVLAAGTAHAQWSDNFNRPDGPIGPNWTEVSGTWAIASNQGMHTGTGVNTVLRHNTANLQANLSVTSLDIHKIPGNTANAFVAALVGLGGTNTLMVKIQAQAGTDQFSNIGIYRGTNGTGWGVYPGGLAFSALTAQFQSARMTITFPNPDTIQCDLDTNFDGIADQTYQSAAVSTLSLGNQHGIGAWMQNATFDNWSVAPVGATGACCLTSGSSNCLVTTSASCSSMGGTYAGDNVTCAAANCAPLPTGACCFFSGSCSVLTQAACTSQGGTYAGTNVTCVAANCPQPPPGGNVYAVDIRATARPLISFPVGAPAYNIVAASVPVTLFALDFDGTGTNLYCITNGPVGTMALGTLDQSTGAFNQIGLISGAGAAEANWGGLTFDTSTNTMFALAGTNLYTVDLTTGNTTLVAPITGGPVGALYIDLAINNAGNLLITHDITTDVMLSVNKTTGAATTLGPTGFLANFAQGMDFDPVSDQLYAAIYTGGGTGAFCSVNTTTGACTSIVNTQPWTAVGPEMEMAIKGVPAGCYADCDGIGGLTANDFICFLTSFNNGASYADCDGVGGLTANDFICFLTEYNNGCP